MLAVILLFTFLDEGLFSQCIQIHAYQRPHPKVLGEKKTWPAQHMIMRLGSLMPDRRHAPSTPLKSDESKGILKHDRLPGDIAAQIPPESNTLTVSVLPGSLSPRLLDPCCM